MAHESQRRVNREPMWYSNDTKGFKSFEEKDIVFNVYSL